MTAEVTIRFSAEAWDKLREQLFPNHLAHCDGCDTVFSVETLDARHIRCIKCRTEDSVMTKCWSCQKLKTIVHETKWQDLDIQEEHTVLVCCSCILTGFTPKDGGCDQCLKGG